LEDSRSVQSIIGISRANNGSTIPAPSCEITL